MRRAAYGEEAREAKRTEHGRKQGHGNVGGILGEKQTGWLVHETCVSGSGVMKCCELNVYHVLNGSELQAEISDLSSMSQ